MLKNTFRAILIGLISTFTWTSSWAQAGDYFPLKVGNWWLYANVQSQGILTGIQDTTFEYYEVISELPINDFCNLDTLHDELECYFLEKFNVVKSVYKDSMLQNLLETITLTAYNDSDYAEVFRSDVIPLCSTKNQLKDEWTFNSVKIHKFNKALKSTCGDIYAGSFEEMDKPPYSFPDIYTPTHKIAGYDHTPMDGNAIVYEDQVGFIFYLGGWASGMKVLRASNLIGSQKPTGVSSIRNFSESIDKPSLHQMNYSIDGRLVPELKNTKNRLPLYQ